MRIVAPVQIGESELVSTTATNEYSDWVAGTYNDGDRVVHNRIVWESLADGVTSEPSADTATDWLRVGYSNRWRMFTEGRDSLSTDEGSLAVELLPNETINTFAALGLAGSEVSLTITDPTDGVVYDETETLVDIGVSDYWDWHFLDYDVIDRVVFDGIGPYPAATIDFVVTGAAPTSEVTCGRVAMGVAQDIGVTEYGTSIEILDYSTKERDVFGNLTLVPRRTITMVDYDVSVSSPMIDFVLRRLQRVAAVPALFIGESDIYRSTITFGVYRGAVQGINSPSISELTLQVEEF